MLVDARFMGKLAQLRAQHRHTTERLGRMRVFPNCGSYARESAPDIIQARLHPAESVARCFKCLEPIS